MNPLTTPLMYVKVGIVAVIIAFISYYIYDYNKTKTELDVQKKKVSTLKESLTSKDAQILRMQKDISFIKKANADLQNQRIILTKEVENLEEKFKRSGKKSFEELTVAKPKLIENIINNASTTTFKCLEKLTGATGVKYETINCK